MWSLERPIHGGGFVASGHGGDLLASGHGGDLVELRGLPAALLEDLAQPLDGLPDIAEAQVERCEAEPQDIGGAEVANDVGGDQSLDNGVAMRVTKGHVTASRGRVARARQRQAVTLASGLDEIDEEVGSGVGFVASA